MWRVWFGDRTHDAVCNAMSLFAIFFLRFCCISFRPHIRAREHIRTPHIKLHIYIYMDIMEWNDDNDTHSYARTVELAQSPAHTRPDDGCTNSFDFHSMHSRWIIFFLFFNFFFYFYWKSTKRARASKRDKLIVFGRKREGEIDTNNTHVTLLSLTLFIKWFRWLWCWWCYWRQCCHVLQPAADPP